LRQWFLSEEESMNELLELREKLLLEQQITDQKFSQVRYDVLALTVQLEMIKAMRMTADLQRQLGLLPEYRVTAAILN
jgi:hypothetical protein